MKNITILILIIFFPIIGQSQSNQIIDNRDGKIYRTLKFDKFEIMAENLNYEERGICYNMDPLFCQEYGRLYNYQDIISDICPKGWHVPTDAEWRFILSKIKGKVSSGNSFYRVETNMNILKLNKSGHASTDQNNLNQVSFNSININGFYASKSLLNNGQKMGLLFYTQNENQLNIESYQAWDISPDYYVSCRCIKNY